jgi:hypothetical protein
MRFMVVEYFKDQDMLPAYKRLRDGGRMLPQGLKYVDGVQFRSMFSIDGVRRPTPASRVETPMARFGCHA